MNIDRRLLIAGLISAALSAPAAAIQVRFMDDQNGSYQILTQGQPSTRLTARLFDDTGVVTTTNTAITFNLGGYDYYGGGGTFGYSSSTGVISSVTISAGNSQSEYFYVQYSSPTNYGYILGSTTSFVTSYGIQVLPAGAAFTGITLRTDTGVIGSNQVTISPDNDGQDESAVITASPPALNASWQVLISTDPSFAGGIVQQMWCWGPGTVTWSGRDNNWRVVPNGTYHLRLQMAGGGLPDDSLSVVVNTAHIDGTVSVPTGGGFTKDGVAVNAWGRGGGGYAQTDANGYFYVGGLKTGQSYTLNFAKSGLATYQTPSAVAASSTVAVNMIQGAVIRVHVDVTQPPTQDLWGSANAQDTGNTTWVNGSVHIASGAANSDNGYWTGDVSFSSWTTLSVMPNLKYSINVQIPNYGQTTLTVSSTSVAPGATWDVSTTIARKAILSGQVSFPGGGLQSPNNGEYVSVTASQSGVQKFWGGVWVATGTASAQYQIMSVDTGTYDLVATVRGYKNKTIPGVVVPTTDLTADFVTPFDEGGKIYGTIYLYGDSTGLNLNQGGGTSCTGGQKPLYVNAWSPTSYNGYMAEACFTPDPTSATATYKIVGPDNGVYNVNTWVPGFQMDPASSRVTVSLGTGTANDMTFRALSGQVNLNAALSLPTDSGANVQYSFNNSNQGNGGGSFSGFLSGTGTATGTISGLGTGLYELEIKNLNPGLSYGLSKRLGVAVTNGATTVVNVDMTAATHRISGAITLNGSLNLGSQWGGVVVNSMTGLQTAISSAPAVNVYTLPLDQNSGNVPQPIRTLRPDLSVDGSTMTVYPSSVTYTLLGLPSGSYLVKVKDDYDPADDSHCSSCGPIGMPDLSGSEAVVYVGTGSVTGVDLQVGNGAKLSGNLTRPTGDASTDARVFDFSLRRRDGLLVWQSTGVISTASSLPFAFNHLANGDYVLSVQEDTQNGAKYTMSPNGISVNGGDVQSDAPLLLGGTIVGKLRDADTGTILTNQNASQFLPNNFNLYAQADPWVQGGWNSADQDNGVPIISTDTGQFAIRRLIPGQTYDAGTKVYTNLSQQSSSKGQKAYAPYVIAGLKLSAGQVLDIGTIDLRQGVNISGRVTDAAGNPLPNIHMVALPTLLAGKNQGNSQIEAYTDQNGAYVLQGVDRTQRYFDVTAAARFDSGSLFSNLAGRKYGDMTIRMVDSQDETARMSLNFILAPADGSLTGQVVTGDGGTLNQAFGGDQQRGSRGATIVLHREGVPLKDDPLGEIEAATDADGRFDVEGLQAGVYTLRAISFGYSTYMKSFTVGSGPTNTGVITLQRGATVSGTILKPDGSSASSSEVNMVVGVDDSFQEFVFGSPSADPTTQLISGYSVAGFRPGVSYNMVLVNDGSSDLIQVATGLVFSSTGEAKTMNLIYRPSPPAVYVTQSLSAGVVTLRFFSTQKLRNLTAADNDLSQILTVTEGGSSHLSGAAIQPSRDWVTASYTPSAGEASFKLRLKFYSAQIDPNSSTGDNFLFNQEFEFFVGVGRLRQVTLSNVLGGECILEGDPSGANFTAGAFDVAGSSRIEVGVQTAADLQSMGISAAGAPPVGGRSAKALAARLGAAAYPSAAFYKALAAAPSVSPFSPFYEVFLPAGVSHTLKNDALITLKYDDSVSTPSALNVYYFDPGNNVYLLENNQRKVDTVNKTITVAVRHLSTFVVLPANAPAVTGNSYTGTEVSAFNFPNPFDLNQKTLTLANAPGASASQTIYGTMIRVGVPPGMDGTMKIRIYDVAGIRVREISTPVAGGEYVYQNWDGRNDAGKKVASGVYIARLTLNDGNEKFFKMAVIK